MNARGAIQSGIQTGGTGGSSAWLARGGHCPDFRRDCLHVSLMMLDGKPEIIPFSCAHTGIGSITLEDFTQ